MATAETSHEHISQLEEFPRFQDLPLEIRLMIWRTVPRQRKIFVVDKPVPFGENRNFRVSVDLGHITRVCHESRDVVLSSDKQAAGEWQRRRDARTDPWALETEDYYYHRRPTAGWGSSLWAYFDPSQDDIYFASSAIDRFDAQSIETLEKLVGPIKRVIVPHAEIDDRCLLFDHFWFHLQLDSISLHQMTVVPDQPACSVLSEHLNATTPFAVDVEDLNRVRFVDSVLGSQPGAFKEWRHAVAMYDVGAKTNVFGRFTCNWTELKSIVRSKWLSLVQYRYPLEPEDQGNPPIDEDGLILNYQHPWVKEWAPSVPQFKAVVMFVGPDHQYRHW